MINALMCVYKSGDVLGLALEQLLTCNSITKILVADGPHKGLIKPWPLVDSPSTKEIIDSFKSNRIYHKYTDHHENRARKNNDILNHTSDDCKWILCVDSDEIYHENDLEKLSAFLSARPKYGRYSIYTIDPYPDFHHQILVEDCKPRVYSYKKGYSCPDSDRLHQYVCGDDQRKAPVTKSWITYRNMCPLSPEICRLYHLNALRKQDKEITLPGKTAEVVVKKDDVRRVTKTADGKIIWKSGGRKVVSEIHPLDINQAPNCIRKLNRDSL